jgi:hypothetical protein
MKNEDDKLNRHLDISAKLIDMGKSLVVEGKDGNDFAISQCGNFMIMLGAIVLDEKDMYDFGQLCAMYSAKRLLDGMERSNSDMTSFMKNKAENETYDEYIKRINKLRGDNDTPAN